MIYSCTADLPLPFDEALERVRAALAAEGFGVLTEIDVQATMKEKLNADYDPYVILGACNPPLAHRALSAQKDIGLFLPCNVIVYAQGGVVRVAAMRPTSAMSMLENDALAEVARSAEAKLEAVIARLA